MPRRDRTGPMGRGSMTGRGLGLCAGEKVAKFGAGVGRRLGLGRRNGFGLGLGRNMDLDRTSSLSAKKLLQEQKEMLQSQLEAINKRLGR